MNVDMPNLNHTRKTAQGAGVVDILMGNEHGIESRDPVAGKRFEQHGRVLTRINEHCSVSITHQHGVSLANIEHDRLGIACHRAGSDEIRTARNTRKPHEQGNHQGEGSKPANQDRTPGSCPPSKRVVKLL